MNKEIEQKYLEKIKEINKGLFRLDKYGEEDFIGDEEAYHGTFDGLLCDLLKELGYEKIVEEYDKASEWFWYA